MYSSPALWRRPERVTGLPGAATGAVAFCLGPRGTCALVVHATFQPDRITIGSHTFHTVEYDDKYDLFNVRNGDPESDADFDATPEGDAISFTAGGKVASLEILSPRYRLQHDGEVVLTLPDERVVLRADQLIDMLGVAA